MTAPVLRVTAAAALVLALPALTLLAREAVPFAPALVGAPAALALLAVRELYGTPTVARAVLLSTGLAWCVDPHADRVLVAGYLAGQLAALALWTGARRRVTRPQYPRTVGPRPIIGG